MRLLYPWLALASYLFFLAALAAGFALVAAVPVLIVAVAAALLAAGQVYAFLRLLRSFLALTWGSLLTAGRMLRDLLSAVFGGEPEPTGALGSYGREALPELFRLVDDVALSLRTRGIDRVYVDFAGNCGVIELRRPGLLPQRRLRVLSLGIPFVYALTLDELRTVLGHELTHLSLGQRMRRATWRFIERVEAQLERMQDGAWRGLNPVYWAVVLAHAALVAANLRWSRAEELVADRRSARALGANHSTAALRKVRDGLPALVVSLDLVARWSLPRRTAPQHLGEAAYRLASTMPPLLRKRLSEGNEGDVRDVADLTHPPTALRIAALRGLPDQPVRHAEVAARYLPDLRNLEAHLTRVALRTAETQPTRALVEQVLADVVVTPARTA